MTRHWVVVIACCLALAACSGDDKKSEPQYEKSVCEHLAPAIQAAGTQSDDPNAPAARAKLAAEVAEARAELAKFSHDYPDSASASALDGMVAFLEAHENATDPMSDDDKATARGLFDSAAEVCNTL